MVATQTSILFKTPEGDFHLTEHGEFLSYFDAHVHLFEVFLQVFNGQVTAFIER
jgi:hypothetical protein